MSESDITLTNSLSKDSSESSYLSDSSYGSDSSESLHYSSDKEIELTEDEISVIEKIPNVSLYLIQTKDKLIGVFLTPDKKNVVGYIDNNNKQISTNESELLKFNTAKVHDIVIDDAYDFTKQKTCNDKAIIEKINMYNIKMNTWFNDKKRELELLNSKLKSESSKKDNNERTSILQNQYNTLINNYNSELIKHKELQDKLDKALDKEYQMSKNFKEEKDTLLEDFKKDQNELSGKLNDAINNANRYKNLLDSLKYDLEKYRNDINNKNNTIDNLQKDISSLKNDIANCKSQLQNAKDPSEKDRLKSQLQICTTNLDASNKSLKELNNNVNDLNERLRKAEQKAIDTTRQCLKEKEDASSKINELLGKLRELNKEKDEIILLKSKLDSAQSDSNQKSRIIDQLKNDISKLKSDIDNLRNELNKPKDTSEKDRLTSELNKTKNDLNLRSSELESLKKDIKELNDQIKDLQNKIKKNDKLEKDYNDVQNKLQSEREKVKVLNNQLTDLIKNIESEMTARISIPEPTPEPTPEPIPEPTPEPIPERVPKEKSKLPISERKEEIQKKLVIEEGGIDTEGILHKTIPQISYKNDAVMEARINKRLVDVDPTLPFSKKLPYLIGIDNIFVIEN